MVESSPAGFSSIEQMIEAYFIDIRVSQNTIIGIAHRIDRPVSGVLLIAKKRSALKDLNQQFADGKVRKTYYALTDQAPEKKEGMLEHFIGRDASAKRAVIYPKPKKGAIACSLSYKILNETSNGVLWEIHPHTGKYHQIRAQLAHVGAPIKGDVTYGGKIISIKDAILLHAGKLVFTHPFTKEEMRITATFPTYWGVTLPE